MSSLFRRKSTDLSKSTDPTKEPVEELPEPGEPVRPKGYTPKKGEATPKRPVANRRVVDVKPKDRKAARALARQRRQEDGRERREGLMNGDDRFLTARDRGPIRRYVRDIVDARQNAGSAFFFGTIIVLVLTMIPTYAVQLTANLAFLAMLLAIAADSVLLARRIRSKVGKKFPKHDERWGSLYFYGIMRALSFRKMRAPKPQVNVGDKV